MTEKSRYPRQTLRNLQGEIDFRAKLARQHVSGEVVLPDYYGKEEHDSILRERVQATSEKMAELIRLGVQLSPFLELGAERGQRSLVLANDFHASGVATDISYHQLTTMEHFSELFGKGTLPTRVCCDANHLPFKSNAFSFVFCYGFLHHFPALKPVIDELHRVLGDGYFYFDEEPFKRTLRLRLYTQRNKIYSAATLKKNKFRTLIEGFISEPLSDEVEHEIIENADITLKEWIGALQIFPERDVDLFSMGHFSSKLGDRIRLGNVPNLLLGGRISGLCRKRGQPGQRPPHELSELLTCPDCTSHASDGFDPPLAKLAGGWRCQRCGAEYPEHNGIIFLLPTAELENLYPAFVASAAHE